jgi:hypothetical protein
VTDFKRAWRQDDAEQLSNFSLFLFSFAVLDAADAVVYADGGVYSQCDLVPLGSSSAQTSGQGGEVREVVEVDAGVDEGEEGWAGEKRSWRCLQRLQPSSRCMSSVGFIWACLSSRFICLCPLIFVRALSACSLGVLARPARERPRLTGGCTMYLSVPVPAPQLLCDHQ